MKLIRKKIGFISLIMATIMLVIATPYQPLLAAMVPTEATLDKIIAQDARDHLKTLISRNDINAVSYTHLTLPTRSCQCSSRWWADD